MMKQYRLVYYMRGFIHNSKRFFPSLDCFRNFRFEWKEFMKGLERLSSSSKTWSFKQKARSWLYGSLAGETTFSMIVYHLSIPCKNQTSFPWQERDSNLQYTNSYILSWSRKSCSLTIPFASSFIAIHSSFFIILLLDYTSLIVICIMYTSINDPIPEWHIFLTLQSR